MHYSRVIAFIWLALGNPLRADEPVGGAKVYKTAVPSVVWVHSTRTNGLATGSGSLIDRERRLILTNFHVVEENPRVTVYFPVFRDGLPIPEKLYYSQRPRLAIAGRVIALDKSADLAVIQIDSVPDDAKGIPLAASSPDPGDSVHSIGNTGKSGALWGYVKGTVRQVYRKKWKAKIGESRIATFEAKVIETDSPTNPGDSGGPLLNEKGELVGVTQGGVVDAQLVSFFVDLSEVKSLLATRVVRDVRGGTTKPTPPVLPVHRDTPLTLADDAKLFSADAGKSANEIVADLHKRGLDVLIETHAKAPADWIEKGKTAKPEERKQLFRDWADQRLKAAKADGFAVLVCLEPRYIAVEIPEDVKAKFPEGFAQKTADALIAAFREKKFDDGLAAVLKLTQDSYRGTKK